MKKKFLLMMMLSLLFTAMGTSVLNAEGTNVAKVGNTEYATIDEAIDAWANNTTLTLLADVTLSDVIKLSSTEYHILDLSTYTMTAASKKDAIQIVNNGRSSASYALDIKADATNPGGITASGKTIVVTTGKSGVKDRPIIRFYNGVFNGSNVVKHSGSNGTNCPQFQFHGGVFNGNINTNRSLNQFYGGTFSGQLWMSVDSSAYTLVAGGTFKNLSNLYGSALNSGKFTIGSAKGVYDKEVYIDDNGNTVIAAAKPEQDIEANVAKENLDTDDYLAYSKVATEGQLGYTDVYTALKKNTTATVTVYVEELDMSEVTNFKGTIVVPEGNDITITNVPENCTVQFSDGTVLTPDESGNVYTKIEVATLDELQAALVAENELPIIITETIVIPADKTVTIDLNGKTVTRQDEATNYAINNLGTLTIQDTKGNGSINARGIYNGYGNGGANVATAKITVLSGTINAKGTNGGGAAIFNYGVADIQGGTFTSVSSYAIALQTGSTMTIGENAIITGGINSWQSTLTITGGTISNDKSEKHVVYAGESAVTINGGTFHNNNSGNATIMASGSTAAVEITGGTFTLNIVDASSSYLIDATSSATYTISGGSFTGGIRAQGGTKYEITGGTFTNEYGNYNVYEGGDINISGGTFTGSYAQEFATDNLAEGYELGANGTVVAYEYPIEVVFSDGHTKGFETLTQAMGYGYSGGEKTQIIVHKDIEESMSSLEGNIVTDNPEGVTIKNTIVDEWIYCSENFTIGEGVTYDATGAASGLFMYAKDAVINGTVLTDCYYQRYTNTKLTINEPGSMTVKTETFILRYTAGDGEAGIYINGDNNDETTGLNAAVIYFYQGCISAKNANIKVGTYWQTNETDNEGSANLVLDNSKMKVTVNEHNMKATGNSTVTLTNGSNIDVAGGYEGINVSMDETSSMTKNGVSLFVAKIGENNYQSLQTAINAVQDGETITLIDNVTVSVATAAYNDGTYIDGVRYTGDKSFTVDFNGKTVTDDGCVNDYLIYINNKGEKASEITFTNGTIVSANGCWSAVCVNSSVATQNVELNLNGMNITNSNDADYSGNPVVRVRTLATVNVNDGTIITSNGASYGVAANTDGSTININEGATIVQQNSGETSGNSVFAAVGGKGVVNIKGGTITSDRYGVHTMTTGTPEINISGGTITAPVALRSSTNGGNGELATINVTGGTINGTLETYTENGKIVVSGGTFSEAVAQEYCAEGYVPAKNADGTYGVELAPVAKVGENTYRTFAEAAAAAQAGDEIKLLANIESDITVPANVTLNGNGFAISGAITADGTITFAGVTKAGNFGVEYVNTVVNIPAGASLQLTGTGRMVIGHGCTFNITGSIADNAAKTADKATLTPSLVMPGASFTGAGVTFNVTNAYINVPSSYCSTKSSEASGIFDFNITNSIWESAGKLAFEEATVNAKVDFALLNSVLVTGSHLVFGTASGEEGVVIDNSNVNVGTSRQIENCGTMTVKNGSVVNGAVATSSNAKNPGTLIVDNATYAVSGEFSGSDLGTGTIVYKKGATISAGSITKANIQIDATGMNAGYEVNITAKLNNLAGTIEVINNNMLDAKIVDGKIVIVERTLQGEGTEANPYLINDVDDLVWLQVKVDESAQDGSTQFAGKYFKLTNDIDLSGINWNPIGKMSGDHGSFKGVFDGGDHTISNLYVEQAGNGIGLFARTTGNAVIKNLKLNNVTVESTDNSNYVGGLVGNAFASTKIENVHVSGNVYISGRGYIGGIAGHGYVVMDNVSVVATGDGHGNDKGLITSSFWCAGGVLGYAGEGATNIMNAQVENVVVTSAAGGLGAIVGMAEDNNGTQPISGSNLSAENVEIKTYIGAYGDSYANYALGYLYGGNPTSILTGDLSVEEVKIETSTGEAPEVNDAVAQIGNSIYFNLQDVLNAGGNVTVLRDIALAEGLTVAADKTVVLDLNGKTISRNTEAATSTAAITNNGNLTIKDSSDPSTGKITAFAANPDTQAVPYYASNTITNCGVLTVLGGTIENSTGDEARAAYPIDNNSTSRDAIVTIEGGKVTGRGAIRQFANSTTHKNEVNVKGGEVFGSSYAIWVQNPNSNDNKAALNIEGGKLSKILISPSAEFDVAITGGELTEVAIWNADETNPERNPSNFISGGTFTQNMEEFCVEGYKMELNENGTYGVVPFETKEYVINANGEIKTLADAIAKAKEDGTDIVTYTIYGAATLETGYSHGIVDFGGREGYITIQGGSDNTRSTDSFTITGGGVPDIKGVTFKDLTSYDEGEYLPTANEFMYQNFIDCTFENVTFEDGIRLSGNSVVRNCTFNANTNDEYAIWLDEGTFEMTGSTVTAGNDAYGLLKSDYVNKITISDNTFQYLAKVNKEALNVNGAIIVAEDNTFIDCAKGVVPKDKTNYTEDGTIPITNEIIAQNNTVVVYVAKINDTKYESLAAAATAAQDGETIQLLWAEGHAPISMNASLYGNKNVTITGNATVDWSKGNLFVGRGGVGNATLTFNGANLTSASNSSSYGIHVSGREKNTNNKYDGTLVIKNGSNIQLDYLIDRGTITIDNATLTVKNGFGIAGRPATETEDNKPATATISLENGAKLIVNNHNGMGVGQAAKDPEGYGIMNINSGSTFETTQSFTVTAMGTMNVNGGNVETVGTLTNNGEVNVNEGENTLNITTLEDKEIKLQHGATLVDTNVGGEAMLYGAVTFKGDNTFTMIYDYGAAYSTESAAWTVEPGASLTLTATVRYGLGYGDNATIKGNITDALTARGTLTDDDLSFFTHGISMMCNWNEENYLTVNDAYVQIGSNNSFGTKNDYGQKGKFYVNFTNSVLTSSRVTIVENGGFAYFTFNGSDVLTGGWSQKHAGSTAEFTNSKMVVTGNGTDYNNANAGMMTIVGSNIEFESGAFTNTGTLNIGENSTFTAPEVVNNGTINFTALSAKLDTDTEGLTIVDQVNNPDYKVVYKEGAYQFVPKDYVAQIGEDKYESLQEAVNVGGEVTVLQDITLTEGITVAADKTVVLDLNGKTITGTPAEAKAFAVITNKGNLTITDGTETEGKIVCDHKLAGSTEYAVNTITNSGTLTIVAGTIQNTTTASNQIGYAIDNNSTTGNTILVIEGGEVTASGSGYYDGIRQFCNSETLENNVTIEGGEVSSLWLQNPSDGSGTQNTKDVKGSFAINGGTLNNLYLEPSTQFAGAITGGHVGNISRFQTAEGRDLEGFITGGTFSVDPTDYCAPDYSPIFNDSTNTYTVIKTSGTFTRTLSSGWSWFSYYIDIEGANGLDALKEDMGAACEQFKSHTAFTFYSNNKWYTGPNALTGTNVEDMYMVKMRESKEISLSGKLAVPAEEMITLNANGWTWIGYPLENSINVSDALATFNSIEGDYIKSKTLYAEYVKLSNGTYAWKGSLNSMIPGEGYKYKSVSGDEKEVYYSSASNRTAVKANVTSENNYWVASNSKYSSNMTVVAMMSIDNEIVNDSYEIAAFANGECRGSARAIYDEDLNAYMLYLTIHGEDVENITFKYYDVNYGTEYELGNVVVYSSDAILGSINNPYMFNLDILNVDEASINEVNVYPNPTTTNAEIDLNATCDKVEVFNALGVKVAEYSNVDSIDALETAGVYVIRVTIDGNVRNCRLVVK